VCCGRFASRICLRDAKYAIECGDTAFSVPFRWLLLRAIAIGWRRETQKDTTLKQYLYDVDRIIAMGPEGEPSRKLHKRMLASRAHLFVFMTNRAVPYINNVSERHLRPSVIFRKATNGFRCEWRGGNLTPPSAPSSAPRRPIALQCWIPSGFVLSTKRPRQTLAGAG
jgi:hypothetical protein